MSFLISEFVENKLSQANKADDPEVETTNDNIIGFDLSVTNNDNGVDVKRSDGSEPPILPERRKNSSRQSSNRNSACEPDRSESRTSKTSKTSKTKEKKKSFIKEWQKDLKEFFSLRKKKSSVENNEVTQETENEGKEIERLVDNSTY